MAKFVWQDGTLVSKAKVEIGGTIYEVDPEEYSGSTPLSASNLNAMVDSTYSDLKDYVDEKQTYSTEETVIGTWLDKPLYRKIINVGNLPASGSKQVSTGLNFRTDCICRKLYGIVTNFSNGTSLPLPFSTTTPTYCIAVFIDDTSNIRIDVGTDRSNVAGYVVLEYTKN